MDISSIALLNSVTAVAPPQNAAAVATPDVGAIGQFQALMNSAPTAQQQVVAPAALSAAQPMPGASLSVGDRILAGLNQVGTQFQSSLGTIDAAVNASTHIGAGDLLKVQMGMAAYSFDVELFGKTMGGLTHAIDELAKLQ